MQQKHGAFECLAPQRPVLVDKGFAGCSTYNPHLNKMLAPPFKQYKKIARALAKVGKALARLRYTSEVRAACEYSVARPA